MDGIRNDLRFQISYSFGARLDFSAGSVKKNGGKMRKEANKLRSNDIFFMPLGGGQRVGASCYFLRLGDTNILLDAGIGGDGKTKFLPDEYSLTTLPFVQT